MTNSTTAAGARDIYEWFQRAGTVFIGIDALMLVVLFLYAFGPSISWPLG